MHSVRCAIVFTLAAMIVSACAAPPTPSPSVSASTQARASTGGVSPTTSGGGIADTALSHVKGAVGYEPHPTSTFEAIAGTLVVPDESTAVTRAASAGVVTLADSSQIVLGENTSVRIGALKTAADGSKGSTIAIDHGAIEFYIRHLPNTHSNYTFTTATTQVAVRGTVGFINADAGEDAVAVTEGTPGDVTVTSGGRKYAVPTGRTLHLQKRHGHVIAAHFTPGANHPKMLQFVQAHHDIARSMSEGIVAVQRHLREHRTHPTPGAVHPPERPHAVEPRERRTPEHPGHHGELHPSGHPEGHATYRPELHPEHHAQTHAEQQVGRPKRTPAPLRTAAIATGRPKEHGIEHPHKALQPHALRTPLPHVLRPMERASKAPPKQTSIIKRPLVGKARPTATPNHRPTVQPKNHPLRKPRATRKP